MLRKIAFLVELIYKKFQNQTEKEILIQPFSFCLVENIEFDYNNYTVDIDLELIQKKEILEEKIKKGKKITFDKNTNLLVIDEKDKIILDKSDEKNKKEKHCNII